MRESILNFILIVWFLSGLIAAIFDYIYESRRKGEVNFNINTICDMALCFILGFFSLASVIVFEKNNSIHYK